MTAGYETLNPDQFGGDRTALEIARNNARRAEGNKLVNPPVRYQAAIKEIDARKAAE